MILSLENLQAFKEFIDRIGGVGHVTAAAEKRSGIQVLNGVSATFNLKPGDMIEYDQDSEDIIISLSSRGE